MTASITAAGMHWAAAWPWSSAIVFGILIAATDPVAVIATFKETGVSGRLRLLVESESLLNDGTAAVAFVLAIGIAMGGHGEPMRIAQATIVTVVGGVLIGGLIGWGLMLLAGRTSDHLVELTFTTVAAYA